MSENITKADRVILTQLSYNARISEKELAKKCNLSKDSIRYRIQRLEKLKIITGYSVFIDYTTLGYNSYKLYVKLNSTIKEKQEFLYFLASQKHVFSIFESNGNWDIATAIFAKNRKEYYEFENKLLSRFGKIINSKKFCLMLDALIFNNNFLLHTHKTTEHPIWGANALQEIDEKDKIILNELHKDSRTSLVRLSEKVKLSVDSTSKRIKKLNEKKIISFYNTNIDYTKLGFEKYKLFIYVKKYSDDFEKNILSFLKNQSSTLNTIRTIGPWKLEVEFLIQNYNEFQKILSQIHEKYSEYIQKLDFSIFHNEVWFPSDNLLV